MERGRDGLAKNRRALCRLLWETWSPDWHFTEETYNRTAPSFDNPDFVDVVIHSYRHRIGNAPGDPRFAMMEQQLAQRPKVSVPSIVLHGADDPLARPPADSPAERALFPALVARRVLPGVGALSATGETGGGFDCDAGTAGGYEIALSGGGALMDQDPNVNPTILGSSCLRLIRRRWCVFAHRSRCNDMAHRYSTLLNQVSDYHFSAVLT